MVVKTSCDHIPRSYGVQEKNIQWYNELQQQEFTMENFLSRIDFWSRRGKHQTGAVIMWKSRVYFLTALCSWDLECRSNTFLKGPKLDNLYHTQSYSCHLHKIEIF